MQARDFQIEIEKKNVVSYMASGKKQSLSPFVEDIIEKLLPELDQLIEPRLDYLVQPIEKINRGKVFLYGGICLVSPILGKTIKHCREAVCFVGTIGSKLEEEIRASMLKGLMTRAYILDAIGSMSVEGMIKNFHHFLGESYARENKGVTLRFSPGYCDWALEEQKKIFSLFAGRETGVQLTDSLLMLPRKSISGIIGVAGLENGKDTTGYNPCLDCPRTDCPDRRGP